ncbi:hypothetical protein BD626DRAFT_571744 [Schizophyllum amplum]|uniref:Uncharacterized protein n=1 Tax=Schizophyllum amplum TaxID=97359 RepID=A0A550C698_9AGAR|nr:hypothetical protein BD626DRAFT_571744 [Auriculariopsis ampla]
MNPFAQGGWYNPGNPNSVNEGRWSPHSPAQPSMFGALPFAQAGSPQEFHSFTFSLRPSILSSTVTGPRDKMYIAVVTDNPKPGFTLLHLAEGKAFGVIQWAQRTIIEVRDIVRKQFASDFLKLSDDGTSRIMEARGKTYAWVPKSDFICLYTYGSTTPELMARVSKGQGIVTLEMSTRALQIGLLEVATMATVLMLSGRSLK